MTDLERMQDDLAAIKARTEHLRRSASYRGGTRSRSDSRTACNSAAPVLLEEYWDVYKALLR